MRARFWRSLARSAYSASIKVMDCVVATSAIWAIAAVGKAEAKVKASAPTSTNEIARVGARPFIQLPV